MKSSRENERSKDFSVMRISNHTGKVYQEEI